MLQLSEPRLLWRRRKRRDCLDDVCCSNIYSSLIIIGCITLLPQGITQHNDEVYIVKPTPAFRVGKEELTTVLLVDNENHGRYINVRPEVGLLTSTARTFIQEGVTTEYATQVVGTTLDNGRVYAQYLKKSSRVLYDSGFPAPSVVTSWVGESLNSDVGFLPQSHNDLFDADQPDWQAIDDRLLGDHRRQNDFVGNTDYVHVGRKPILPSISKGTEESFLATSSSSDYTTNNKPAFNFVGQLKVLDENALKVAANKVLPVADLPTYTIKQNYEPSSYLVPNDQAKLKEDIDSGEVFSRNPKLIYKKVMQSSLKSNKNESDSFTSLRPIISARQFATVTYYGFAEFTTVVGDSVIVFSPSTSTSNLNYNAHVTSIKGEATLGTGLPQGPSVSKVPITIAQDIIEPTITQQSTVEVLLEKPVITNEAKADEKESYFSFTSTKTVENKSMDTEEPISILETSEIVLQSSQDKISSAHSTTIMPSVMLSRPSNEEILRIYNALANAGKSKIQSSSDDKATNFTTSLTYADKVHSETSNVQTFGGATTIFFEDDPFANFVASSKTSINLGSTIASQYNSNSLSNDIISTESSSLSKDTETKLLETVNSTEVFTEQGQIIETTTDESLTTTEKYIEADVNNTIVTSEPDTDQLSEDNSNPRDILSTVLIKEINPNNGNETLSDCISTSQVFLTQLPKTVTHFETVIAPDASVTSRLKTEVREQIHRTYEVKEATKYYCIQASTTQANYMENLLVSPTVYTAETEGLDAAVQHSDMAEATERNSEEDETETGMSSTTEDNNNENNTERTDLNESDNFANGDLEEEDDEEGSGQLEDDEEEEEIELIYKTLYTTYTYLTTFFLDDSTSISSHTDVVTNIMTSTLGRSSLKETSPTKLIANLNDNEINPTGTINSIQMEATKRFVVPSEVQNFIRTGEEIDHERETDLLLLSDNSILANSETDIMSHTEVITNVKKSTASATTEDEKLVLTTPSLQTMINNENLSSTIILDKESVINYDSLRKTVPSSKTRSLTTVISNVMANLPNIPDLGDLSAITLVTDVRSSSSPGNKQIINNFEAKSSNDKLPQQESLFEDQISSETNIDGDEIMPSATLLLQTSFTTFTYYTTMYSGEETNVISRLETMTNTVTETLQPSKTIDLVEASAPTTYFTTFTYWTKLAREGQITTLSREETVSNVITPTNIQRETSSQTADLSSEKEVTTEELSMTEASLTNEVTLQLSKKENKLNQSSMAEILINTLEGKYNTNVLEPTTYYTTYTYYTTSYEVDKTITDSRFETVTNIITPTATLTYTGLHTEDLVTLESPIVSSSLTPVQEQSNTNPSKSDLVLYDFKKIIDADGISTIFFTTEIKQTTNLDGSLTEVSSSSSSLLINEEKQSIHATAIKDSSTPILGPDGQVQKQYKTGLVRLIEGTRIANFTTTLYQSKVIGTVIDQRYAQIIESTSSFIFEKTKAPVDTINLSTLILPTSLSNSENIQPTDQIRTLIHGLSKVEGSIVDYSTEQEIETSTKQEVEADEENNSKTDEKLRFPFQTKKSPVISPLKPFSNRNRPQFAPKKNSSATIITRSDFTPTITATPALKTISRYSSARRGSSSGISGSNSAFIATSSKRFGRPNKSAAAGTAILASSLAGATGFSGGSRNRFASSSNARGSFASSSRRLGSSTATVRPSFSRPFLFSSSLSGNSRVRVRPTATRESEDVLTSVDIFTSAPLSSQEDGLTQDESEEVEENTTESNRRQNNPLLRLRRPLNRPQGFTPARLQPNSPNNAVSLRRNPLVSRSRSGNTATLTTTTTTAKPKPRTFQSPIISQNRIRPTNSLFPPRNIFGVQKPAATTEENRDLSEEDVNENNDDSEYEDEEDEESEGDDEEENSRRRRSNNKAGQIPKTKKRNKRESDSSHQNRSNFRNRFRRPKLTSPIQTEFKSSEDDKNETKDVVTTSVPLVISSHKSRTRFGSRFPGHPSSSSSTTTATSAATSSNHKAIRPTRPSSNNSGRAQFTLREKDFSVTSTTQKGLTSVKRPAFRRPQPGGSLSSRRIPSSTAPSSSTSGKRRLKSFSNNDSTTTSRNPVTGRSRSSSTISGRSRSSAPSRDNNVGGRNRSRNKLNNEALSLDNSGSIIVTHVVPAEVTIPVVNGKVTEYKQVVTAKTSTEILGPQQYTTTIAANGLPRLALTREDSSVNYNGATEVTRYILHETPTTTITFTPTTIRGRKTSFSHVLPSTVYSVETLVSTVQPQISANAPLANILLSQLLLGNVGLPAANPLLEALGGALTHPGVVLGTAVGTAQPATPLTEYKTHASTYVTTVFEGQSTVLPVTFQGKKILTTIFDTTAQTITATEFITDTIVTTPSIMVQPQPVVNSLLLQQLLLQQHLQQQQQPAPDSIYPLNAILNSVPPQFLLSGDNLQELEASNNIRGSGHGDFPNEDDDFAVGSSVDLDDIALQAQAQTHKNGRKKSRKNSKNHKRKNNNNAELNHETDSSVITLYVSGRRPGEFSTVLSTVQLRPDSTQYKRHAHTVDSLTKFLNDGSEIVNEYLAVPPEIVLLDSKDKIENEVTDVNEGAASPTNSLESFVGDVSLWYATQTTATKANILKVPKRSTAEIRNQRSSYNTVEASDSNMDVHSNSTSQNLHKQFQHFDSGQDVPKSLNPLNTSYDYSNIGNTNDIINKNKDQSDDVDEARYNLATRIMSNGVEVIIASDKTKTPDHLVPDIYNTQLQYKNPMTLAASTIKNQMMILLFPSSLNTTQPSSQQDGRTTVESREKVISNIATEERNYPKITPTQAIGVTLTKTPELAVGIFPTTYSYFNTYKDNTHKLQVMTSEYTVVNTITGPNDYIAYLQPTAKATPALETNTYYNEITLSQKINSKIHTVKRNITQVVVTKSYAPAYSASVLTSYYAYDGESLDESNANLNMLTTLLTLNDEEKDEENLNTDNMKKTEDIHIYATKTFLTTFTYYTTTVISSYSSDSSQTKLGIKHMSTVFNYYTRVIENVITDSVPSTLLPDELLAKMKIELSKQKPHQRHPIFVTTATLKNGQEIKISAMEMYKDNLASVSLTLAPPLKNAASQSKPEESLNYSQEKVEEYSHNEETDKVPDNFQLEESLNYSDHLPSLANINRPVSQEEQEENNGLASLPSEQILTVVKAPNSNPTNINIPQVINNKPPTSAATHLIQRLTALKPMFSAVADLLQNNFGVTRETIKPVTSIESKQASNKKINSSTTNTTSDTKHPIYIPVPKIPIKNNLYEITNYTDFVPQGLHIKPPLLVNGNNNFEMNDEESALKDKYTNIIPFSTFTTPRQEQPLHNGGIYIRPGEIITANSDLIVGKPNGIEYFKVPNQQYLDKNTSKVYPSGNRFEVTYYHNKVQHSYKNKPASSLTSITHKPHHIPIVINGKTNNKLKPQPTYGLRPLNEQLFNKNILKPPPPPQKIQSSIPIRSQQGLSLTLTAPDKPTRNRSKQQTTTTALFSAEPASPMYLPPFLATTTHRTLEFPPSLAPPSRNSQAFYNFNNELKNREIPKIFQKTQGLSTDLKSSSMKISNSSKLLNSNPKPQAQHDDSLSQITINTTSFENKSNSLNWHNIRKPQTFETAMRLQPETNIVQQEKETGFAEYFPKHTASLNWDNGRESQTKISTSPLYINEYQKQNFDVSDKSSEQEIAFTESSIAWNFESVRQPQTNNQFSSHINKVKPISFEKYKNSELISNQHKRRPASIGLTNQADTKLFFRTLLSTPNTKFSYNLSSKSIVNNEKQKNYSNKSVTKNHQNVSLDQHIFSHTVDVNVPPLTFNREDYDYPQQAATAVRGQIPPAAVKELYTQAENAYKLMPLIKIPANEQQVQVRLTPTNLINAITLPLEVSNDPSWNTMKTINDNNNNNIVRKISLPTDNLKLFLNNQDQKTLGTNNVLNINLKPEKNSDWKHHRRQQQPMLVTTKPAMRQTDEKKPKTEPHLKSTLKSNRKEQQTKESIGLHVLSSTTIQPLLQVSTDLKHPSLSQTQPQILLNELKTASTKPSRFIPKSSDCLEHNSENEPLGTQNIQTTEETFKPGIRGTRVSTQKTIQPDNFPPTTVSSKISKTTASIQKKSKSTAKDINKNINLNKTDEKLMQATEIAAHGETFKKTIFNNIRENLEVFSIKDNQTRMATIFVSPGEAFRTSLKITTVKPKLKQTKEKPSKTISRETDNMVPSKIDTKSSPLKTNSGLYPPPVTILTHLNSTSKVVLSNYSLLNNSKRTYGETNKRQPNKTNCVTLNSTDEKTSEEFISANTITHGKQGVTQPDENFERQNVVTIKAVKNNEIAISQENLSLATKNLTKQNENKIRKSNESLKFFNLQPSESYEGKVLIATTSPLAATTLTFTTTTTTTIKRIIMPTKYITNKRVYTVTAIASVPDLLQSSPTYLNSNSVLYTTKTTTEVTTLFLTHTQINTIVDTVTSVKTLDPITITATTPLEPSATQRLLTKLTSIQSHMPELGGDDPLKYTVAHTLEENHDLTYLPYPSIEVVSTNITQESTLNPNDNSIFIIMTNNKNKKNTVFTHHTPSKEETIPQELADDKNIGEIDETNEVMIEYDNGISFDDISIREEESPQIVNGKSVASSAFVNNEVSVTESSSDNHVIMGGVLIATPPKLPTEHLHLNKSTNISCHPKCKASRNEQCGLVDNNWSCFCRPGFARTFPDRSCKPTYIYDLIMHADRVGNYALQYVSELENNKTEHYRQLSQLVSNALDRMIMQSDFRDVYYGAEVTRYAGSGRDHPGIMINVLLQLSDNSNEKRLEEVLKKNMRLSNYSIGGTDLYTNKAGVDALTVKDFNECVSRRLHDCSENAHCFNLPGTYTCSCMIGFADLSENPTYPGRICSSEQIGCEMCHYHGKCLTLVTNSNDRNYCECFPWYAGSKCQVNLKILLIVLLGIGTLLFILLLFCILITCTKRRNHLQHTTLAPSTMTSSSEGLQKNSRLSTSLLFTSVGLRNSLRGVSLKNNKRQKPIKIDKRLMIKDSSSETSQNSLPYVLSRDPITSSCNKKKSCLFKQSKKYRNCDSQLNKIEQYPVPVPSNIEIESKSDLNNVLATSSSFKKSNQQTEHQILLGNVTEYEGHYCEQSDRSLTVMIPRAKYHSSVLSQTQLMHHQLTMERVRKVPKSEKKLINADNDPDEKRNHKKNLSTTNEINGEESHTGMPCNPGALISAGFEVSAIVRDKSAVVNSGKQQNDLVHFGSITPNYNLITTSESATSLDSISDQKHHLSVENQQFTSNKKFSSNESEYKCEKDLIETMDQWLGNVKLNELSAEARSFDETTIRASTKALHVSLDGTQTQLQDEVNTMAERDLGSTFLLPHTHLYKPERESELSGLDSF